MLHSEKRVRIVALINEGAQPRTILGQATIGPADKDYERRLRLWAADCAARAIHLVSLSDYTKAEHAVAVARSYARGMMNDGHLKAFACDQHYEHGKQVFYCASEAYYAAILCAQQDVYTAAMSASHYARNAIHNTLLRDNRQNVAQCWDDELMWQVERLRAWFGDSEPTDWPMHPGKTNRRPARQQRYVEQNPYTGFAEGA